MGCFVGAELCELDGDYSLQQLSKLFEYHSVGLYRDYNLAIWNGLSGPETERVQKKMTKSFKDNGLKITIKANLDIVNFLDITLDLCNNTYIQEGR